MDITMPQLGETVTEGTITRWLKQVGDHVQADEPLFEVSTDKVDSEVPAPNDGWVTEIRVPEGETVSVGSVLAVVSSERGAAAPAATSPTPAPAAPSPPPEPEPAAPAEPAATAVPPEPAPAAEPAPAVPAVGAAVPAAPAAAAAAPAAGLETGDADARLTSPVVRRLLAEHGLDPAAVRGTGEGGRITRRDVLDAAAARPAAPAASPAPSPAAPAAPAEAAPAPVSQPAAPTVPAPEAAAEAESRDTVVPFTTMRKIIAEHLVHSLANTAHVSAAVEVDFERVERVRQSAQEEWRKHEGFPLNYLPFVGRAVCDAIDEFPVVNARIDGTNLVLHGAVHLAIAVDLNFEGLVTPVIRDADGKRLRAIAREIKDLAERARAKRLSLDLLQGGTFTITNPGPFGTYITLPIINEPQVAILSTDGIQKRPVVVEGPSGEDVIAIHHMGMLALTWDHRAFDGAYAAAFLRRVKQIIETHDWEVELD